MLSQMTTKDSTAGHTFLKRLRDYISSRTKEGATLSENDLVEITKIARASAGGLTSARNKRDKAAAVASEGRLFFDFKFAEPPSTINVLPKPGDYKHPAYGTINITVERNANFVNNFNSSVYQKPVPIDIEHETKLSGAAGWINDLVQNSDGSVDAYVTWTDRGSEAIKADKFKFFSPEWYTSWVDPLTTTKYDDVLIGGAICTRPFFKEPGLRPLVAKEDGELGSFEDDEIDEFNEDEAEELTAAFEEAIAEIKAAMPKDIGVGGISKTLLNPCPECGTEHLEGAACAPGGKKKMTVEEQLAELKAANEAQAAKNAELATQVATLLATQEAAKTASEAADTARQAAEERVKTLEAGERSRRFSDLVDGKGGAGDGLRWYGPKEDHLKMMEALSTAFGEDSEPFKNYVSMQEGNAKRLNTSGIFEEKGTRGAGEMQSTGDPVKDLVAAVRKDKPTMTEAEAYAEVMNTSEGQKAYNEQVKLERRQQARE